MLPLVTEQYRHGARRYVVDVGLAKCARCVAMVRL